MQCWQLQEAKAKLSEVVTLARESGPQEITLRGKRAVVVLSAEEFDRLAGKKDSFLEFMRKSPLTEIELEIDRDRSLTREIEL